MGIGHRIKEARERLYLTQTELGALVGVTGSAITNYEKGTSHPKEPIIYKLMETLNVDANYLFQDMMKNTKQENDLTIHEMEHIKKYRLLDPYGQETVNMILDREVKRYEQLKEAKSPVPIIDIHSYRNPSRCIAEYFRSASAGGGVFILGNEATSQIRVSEADWDERTDFVISVSGDSMKPDYLDGDKVLVSQRLEMTHGDVGIFVVNGKAYIKEYGEKELISRNPKAENIKISEYDNIVCMGKVIGKLTEDYELVNN